MKAFKGVLTPTCSLLHVRAYISMLTASGFQVDSFLRSSTSRMYPAPDRRRWWLFWSCCCRADRPISPPTVTAAGAMTAIEVEEGYGAIIWFTFTGEQLDAPIPAEALQIAPPIAVPVGDAMPPL